MLQRETLQVASPPAAPCALLDVGQWEEFAEIMNTAIGLDQHRRGPRSDGWQTKLTAGAVDRDGQPVQIVIGTVLDEAGNLSIAVEVAEGGSEVELPRQASDTRQRLATNRALVAASADRP